MLACAFFMSGRRAIFGCLLVLALGAALRLPALGWLPSPSGDEGNWVGYGQRLHMGMGAALEANAAFVSLLYAQLIAAVMGWIGPEFVAGRLVNAVAGLLTIAAAWWLPTRLGSPRVGAILALLVAIHPWSVAYSRVASVPYALGLLVLFAGPLVFLLGVERKRPFVVAVGVQLVSLGAHFSPLCLVGAVACALYALPRKRRWVLAHGWTWASIAIAEIHVLPVVQGALAVARAAPEIDAAVGAPDRWLAFLHMVTTGLAGEATVRHFSNAALPAAGAWLLAVPVAAVAALAASRRLREASLLARFGALYLGVGLVLLPLILAPGREWEMPATHMDRYLFAVLPGFLICAAAVAAEGGRLAAALVAVLALWSAGATGRLAWTYAYGHGVDHGEFVAAGGSGYRGWMVADEARPTLEIVREAAQEALGPAGGLVLYADRSFGPLGFFMRGTGIGARDVRRVDLPSHPSGRFVFVFFSDRVLALDDPPSAPPKYVAAGRALRKRMEEKFARRSLIRTLRQRDGFPLIEVWLAEEPLLRRLRMAAD